MYNNTAIYIFNRLVRLTILFFILYLIFTNFGTFLLVVGIIFIIISFLIYNFRKKMKNNSFKFKFDSSGYQNGQNFDFKNFNQSDFKGFANAPRFDEVQKAKDFFGFTHSPTKEEIKKRYKELAKIYHPDINHGDDVKMKELNHFRDILIKTVE